MPLRRLISWRKRREDDLEAEIASHLAMAARDRVNDGEDPRAAYFAARKEFGNVTLTREATKLSWGGRWIEGVLDLLRDVRYAARLVAKSRGYALIVVVVLAMGIAGNVMTFGLFKALALAPLSGVQRSGSLLFVGGVSPGNRTTPISYPDYLDIRERAFPGLAAWAIQQLVVGTGDTGQLVMAEWVTGNYFAALGVAAQHGRTIAPADASRSGSQPVVVISDAMWRRSFAADPAVVGTSIRINTVPMTIVGIAAPDFRGGIVGLATDVFVPFTMSPELIGRDVLENRHNRWVHAFMRPPDGMPRARVEALATAVSRELSVEHPIDSLMHRAFLVPIWQWPYGAQSYMLPAVGLMGAMSALLLLVVSANAAGLVLVRSLARRGESAVRLALGASRGRILRQLLIESLVLALPAAVIGFLLPGFAEPFLGAAADNVSVPLHFNTGPDRFVVSFTLVLTFVTALMCGVVPSVKLSRVDLASVLKDDLSPRGSSKSLLRTSLVVAQLSMALVLLVGTALILRTLEAAQHADAGFDPREVTWAAFDARGGGHDEASGRKFYRSLLDAVRADSGVTAASLATFVPLNLMDMMSWDGQPEGYQPRRDEAMAFAVNVVSTDYFRTMGIPLVAGRDFDAGDDDAPEPPLIVNETFARRFWRSPTASIGKRVATNGRRARVIGVARDIKYARLDEQPRPYMYVPFSHFYLNNLSLTLQVRTPAAPAAVLERIRQHARAIDPGMPILDSGVMPDQLRSASALYETLARMLSVIGVMAAALAALGVYGLVAYTVRQSAHEIGIRAAVGATRGMILRRFLRRGIVLTLAGVAIGIIGSLALARLMATLLYNVSTTDLTSFAGASLLLFASALIASLLPAWRGSRVDPVVALRHQ